MAYHIRKDVLTMAYQANVGHISSSLCIVDLLTVLYFRVLRVDPNDPTHPARDRFILSKGHAASSLYATLANCGFIKRADLFTYCQDGGHFSTHPEQDLVRGIELTTGSLGHGLSVGLGMALGLQNGGKSVPRVFVLLSDSELEAGSTWEAAMFAAHHKLDNLTAVVDINGLQAFGRTRDVLNPEPIDNKWQAFGWSTISLSGHDVLKLVAAMKHLPKKKGKPTVILAYTIGGKGVSFMENTVDWHYWSLDKEKYERALNDLTRGFKKSLRVTPAALI